MSLQRERFPLPLRRCARSPSDARSVLRTEPRTRSARLPDTHFAVWTAVFLPDLLYPDVHDASSFSHGSCWTAVLRALGFVRDLPMTTFLGAGLVAEACMVAFRFPNLFRHVLAEGAFSAALTPMCTLAFRRKVCPAHGTSYTKRSPSGHAFCCLDGCISPGLALS